MTKREVAIIGGTFDPVHTGHVAMAEYLSTNYIVDEVWMLPSYKSPHKEIDTASTFFSRTEMLKLAIKDLKNVRVETFEKEYYESKTNANKDNEIKTYTLDILDALKNKYLNICFYFVVGFDSMKQISTWYNYKDLLKKYYFYVFDRKDDEFTTRESKLMYLKNLGVKFGRNNVCELLDAKIQDVSSTEIREMLKDPVQNQEKLKAALNPAVLLYIITNNLYK